MTLRPIGRGGSPLADETYRRISEAMLAGELPPGSRLVMDTLAERLGTSRTPVRDALHRLEREGLVEPTGRRGYTVRAVAAKDLMHLYESRIAVEAHSARRVAELGEPAISDVEAAIEKAVASRPSSAVEAYRENRAIHRAVVMACANPILVEMVDSVWERAKALQIFEHFHTSIDSAEDPLREHFELTEAMRVGPERAYEVMCEHINAGFMAHENSTGRGNGA